jgi:signal transduction histidine kinase/CheY-like chemotaxis protein
MLAFVLSPLIAIWTKGKYYIARSGPFNELSNQLAECTVCTHHYAEADSTHCPHHEGIICSLCCTLESTCKDKCKPTIETPLDSYREWVHHGLGKLLGRDISQQASLRVANFALIWSAMLVIIAMILWMSLPAKLGELDAGAFALIGDYRWRVFFGGALLSSMATWWIVLVSESRDIAEDELRFARDRAEDATRAKSDFLANMSHEIRTPMNAIIGMSHLALQSDLNQKQRNYISKVKRAAENLLGIINDILDFSKIEAGKLTIEETEFRIEEVMDHLEDLVGLKAEDKGLVLKFLPAPDVPAALIGDPLRLGQILINLGNNAVKFTDAGEIHIGIETVSRQDDQVVLHFWVTDTGIGMTPEQCGRMFQSFSQADSSTTRKYGGTGLGLAISKNLVELMNGRIWVDSISGTGSTFHFHAQFGVQAGEQGAVYQHERPSAGSQAEAMKRLAGSRVLLVEDNEMNQELAVELLRSASIRVVVAANGQEALDVLARDSRFDGVLMDCQMPVMDGYAATLALRAIPALATLPVIAMTANAMAGDKEKVLDAGMNDHIAKPIDVAEMFSTMARWISPGAMPQSAETMVDAERTVSQTPIEGLPALEGIDTHAGMAVAMGKLTLYRRLLQKFHASQSHFDEAFALAQESSDASAATRCAHTLKGNAANIGAKSVARAAGELEAACARSADQTVIGELLAKVMAELAPVLAGLVRMDQPEFSTSGTTQILKRDEVLALAQLLAQQLADADAEAVETVQQLQSLTDGTVLEQPVRSLSHTIFEFNFEQAERALGRLTVP